MIERTVYQCEHCKKVKRSPKIYFTKEKMYLHELNCLYDVKRRTCFTCEYNTRQNQDNLMTGRSLGCALNLIDWSKDMCLSEAVKRDCDQWELAERLEGLE